MLTLAVTAFVAPTAVAATPGGATPDAGPPTVVTLGDNASGGGAAADGTVPATATQPVTQVVVPTPKPTAATRVKRTRALGDRLPLRKRMTGSDVRTLQSLLHGVGRRAQRDGVFGPQTVRMLKSWERSARRRPDGMLSSGDLARLRAATGAVRAAPLPASPGGAPATAPTPGTTTTPTTPTQVTPVRPITSTIPATPFPVSPFTATITPDGLAVAPPGAPPAVQAAIAAGNAIARTPYRYGGGHKSFTDTAYDCSGSVSYALHGAALLNAPLDSTSLESWGVAGAGSWITVYANAEHTFMVIAGIRFDTSGRAKAGTRWQPVATRTNAGFVVRHPIGL